MNHNLRGADYVLMAAVLGLMGAFYWAIRGTGGFGGATGGTFAGFGWALLWYAFSHHIDDNGDRRPYGGAWMLWAITLGIAFGGLTGYGVYISWLNGKFPLNHPDLVRDVPAWTGYAMLFVCGLHWGGNTGCFMAWCAPERPLTRRDWAVRVACGVAGAVAAALFVRLFPQLVLPYYGEGLYDVPEYKTCQRALGSVRNIAPHLGLVLGFLAYEVARGDRRAVGLILTMALGFAVPFTVGGYWQTMHGSPLRIDWWKNWEMTIGLGGGLAFGLAFCWYNRPGQAPRAPLGPKSRAFFASGFPLWLPFAVVLFSAYDGWCELHHIERTPLARIALLILSLIPFLAAAVRRKRRPLTPAAPYRLSLPAIASLLVLLVLAGYVTSIPPQLRLANTVLLTLYTIYITVSLACVALLVCRRAPQGE